MSWSPAMIADWFDRMEAEAARNRADALARGKAAAARRYGADSWKTAGLGLGLDGAEYVMRYLDWITEQARGKPLIDMLRLGESVVKPSWGAALRDGLRILSVVPGAGAGARMARIALARRAIIRAPNNCVFVGLSFSARMAGAFRMRGLRPLMPTIESMFQEAKGLLPELQGGPHWSARAFEGVRGWGTLTALIENWGIRTHTLRILTNFRVLRDVAQRGNGTVLMGMMRAAKSTPGRFYGHVVTLFRSAGGEVMVADQSGIRTYAAWEQWLARQTTLGNHWRVSHGFLVENAAWISRARGMSALPGQTGALGRQLVPDGEPIAAPGELSLGQLTWIGASLALPIMWMPGAMAVKMDADLRHRLGRKPRPPAQPATPAAGGASEADVETLWRAVCRFAPEPGLEADAAAVFMEARLPQPRFNAAARRLAELRRVELLAASKVDLGAELGTGGQRSRFHRIDFGSYQVRPMLSTG